jgi:hypothetical protein
VAFRIKAKLVREKKASEDLWLGFRKKRINEKGRIFMWRTCYTMHASARCRF